MTQADPFDEIVDATGLSKIIAKGIVERALAVVDASIESAEVEDYVRAMPVLRTRLAAFVEVDALARLDALAHELRERAGLPWEPRVVDVPSQPPVADARAELRRVLRGTKGPHLHETLVLEQTALFGRAPAADVQILDNSVSRQHARVSLQPDGSVTLADLGSCNGTFVAGNPIVKHTLRSGDLFQIGEAEYAYEETRAPATTSKMFRDKLVNDLTAGATSQRIVAVELLRSDTAEMPHLGHIEQGVARSERPTRSVLTVRGRMGHLPEARTPTRDTPSLSKRRRPTQDDLPLLADIGHESTNTLRTRGPAPVPMVSLGPTPVSLPPDPLPTPPRRPRPTPTPVPAPAPTPEATAASRRIANTVAGMLDLRGRESDGKPLKVSERSQLRRLEAGLRTPRNTDDRRRWKRLGCILSVELGDRGIPGTLLDISGGGAQISCPNLPVAEHDLVTMRVPLGEGRIAVFRARAVRVDPDRGTFGIRFLGAPSWEQIA